MSTSRLSISAIGYAVALLLAIAAPTIFYPVLLMKVLCFALFACAFNLLVGFTGLLSFGHAAFFGGAAYACGYALTAMGLPTEVGLLAGVCAGAALGAGVGVLAIRRQGIYFTMITLALAQMFYFVVLQAPFARGEDGLQGVPRGKLFGVVSLNNDLTLYYLILTICIAAFVFIMRIVNSPFGEVIKAIKDNEPRAISLGYDVEKYKLGAFVLSSSLAALAGALKTLCLGFATLVDVHWSTSGAVILMTLVGGLGTLSGPIIGAITVVALENKIGEFGTAMSSWTGYQWFDSLGESVTIVTGLIFIVCVMAFRRGIIGEASALVFKHTKKRTPTPPKAVP